MKKIVILFMMCLLALSFASAIDNEICTSLQSAGVQTGTEVPGYVPFKNERINVYTFDETAVASIVISDKVITAFTCDETTEATFNVHVLDGKTVDDIFNAESPVDTANKKIKEGSLKIEGVTSGKKIKMFFAKIGLKIAGWFV